MKIGKIIRAARNRHGLTQSELAEAMGVSSNYISLLENDHRDPSWKFVCDLAKAVRTPLPILLMKATEEPIEGRTSTAQSRATNELMNLYEDVSAHED